MLNVGLCLSDLHPQVHGDGSQQRTASATHFAGHHRLIDFMLSNMVNSGIHTVAIVLDSHYQSLVNHIGAGREWDLALLHGGVRYFPPYQGGEYRHNDMADEPLQRILVFLNEQQTDHVLVTDGCGIYNVDFRAALAEHRNTGADVTALYVKKTLLEIDLPFASVLHLGEQSRVSEIVSDPSTEGEVNLSMGAFIVKKTVLLQLLLKERFCDIRTFIRTLLAENLASLKMMAWEHKGYVARIDSLSTFFYYNMDMLDQKNRKMLFENDSCRIHTKVYNTGPIKYGEKAEVRNSLIANGCLIEGKIENSVIFQGVHVGEAAVVRNSILLRDTIVSENAELNWIITDAEVIIRENRTLLGYKTHPIYIERGKLV